MKVNGGRRGVRDDKLFEAFCADLQSGLADVTAPKSVVEKAVANALSASGNDACTTPAVKKRGADKKHAFTVAAVGVAACLALLVCFVPFRAPSANADVVVNECRSIPQNAISFTGYYQVDGLAYAQFEVNFEWRGSGISSVTYSMVADGISIWLANETFSRGSGAMEGDGKQATAYYSYAEDGSALARCVITVDLGLVDEVERNNIEQTAREILAGTEVKASAQSSSGEREEASCRIL